MKFNPMRGAKTGLGTALAFAIVTPINSLIRHEPIIVSSIATGAVFALCLFGVIGGLTERIGGEVGDA